MESGEEVEGEGERTSNRLHIEHTANIGLNLTTPSLGPKLTKPKVRCLTEPGAPSILFFFFNMEFK